MKLSQYAKKVGVAYRAAFLLYGQRRAKRKAEAIVKQLQEVDD